MFLYRTRFDYRLAFVPVVKSHVSLSFLHFVKAKVVCVYSDDAARRNISIISIYPILCII